MNDSDLCKIQRLANQYFENQTEHQTRKGTGSQ